MTPKEEAQEKKRFTELFTAIFYQAFIRRQKILYGGIAPAPNVFVLGTEIEDNFRYCEPSQGLGLVVIKNQTMLEQIRAWFTSTQVPIDGLESIYMNNLGSFLNKVKWDLSQTQALRNSSGSLVFSAPPPVKAKANTDVVVEQQEPILAGIAKPMRFLHAFSMIADTVEKYYDIFVNNKGIIYDHPYQDVDNDDFDISSIRGLHLTLDEVEKTPLWEHHQSHIRAILTYGLDLLSTSGLLKYAAKYKKDQGKSYVRFWAMGRAVYYGHVYDCEDFQLIATRPNTFLLPRI